MIEVTERKVKSEMVEKRRAKRLELEVSIELSRISEEDGVTTLKMARVDVIDLSRNGIGFFTNQELEIGSFYTTKIQIWTKDIIEAIIKVIRCTKEDGGYHYGAIFVGMIDKDALKIDVYQMFFDSENNK